MDLVKFPTKTLAPLGIHQGTDQKHIITMVQFCAIDQALFWRFCDFKINVWPLLKELKAKLGHKSCQTLSHLGW